MRGFTLVEVAIVVLILMLIFAILVLPFIIRAQEVKVFNRAYNTSYTTWEWLTSRKIIKDYIGVGEIKRYGIELNQGGN